jgi:hypothetical protein
MFQATQRRISEKIKSTLDSDALPFHEILDADMVESAIASKGVQFKDRIYTPSVTRCLFLSQGLDQDHSCRAAVMRLVLWMALNDRKPCSMGTAKPALLRTPLDGLAANEILLGDGYFGSFFMLEGLMRRELDGLFRMYQGRKFDFRRGRRLGVEDHLVTWVKPTRPNWINE